MSGHPAVQQALRNPYFDGLGLPRRHRGIVFPQFEIEGLHRAQSEMKGLEL
jgi:hypothetical protein